MKQENIDCLFKCIELAVEPNYAGLSAEEKEKLSQIKIELEIKLKQTIDPEAKKELIKLFAVIMVEIFKATILHHK